MYADRRKPTIVLLVEDDPADQELTQRGLRQDAVPIEVRVAHDGQEAIEYLTRQGKYAHPNDSPAPHVILLDLNMPRVNGRELLMWLRSSHLHRTPTIILTTSEQEKDIIDSYNFGCNCYLTKPVKLDEFLSVVRTLGVYWCDLATLPPEKVV